ncbi:MAG: UDP-3-O-[3-hydroxymyristoyl] N-acetylglucosamine deacetylase [Alphaproteobacteria bacterium CG_4_10_14_0_8_um_filter_53_9]|nr:MAG: UDP-3-O-[3-hydroxymyristoyl] N-acetylglucosamine deacetylase [Alphaproteobacteria bacterium CG_4_10_14_0_8_um_filter_53_9]
MEKYDLSAWYDMTLKSEVFFEGIGLHTGEMCSVKVYPLEKGAGVRLRRVDVDNGDFGVLRPDLVVPGPLCTLLCNEYNVTVQTVEHLLAAIAGLGIVDVEIAVMGPEVPILDGSARPFVEAFLVAGMSEVEEREKGFERPHAVRQEDVTYEPAGYGVLHMRVAVAFDHPLIGEQVWAGEITPRIFIDEISGARTFILEKDLGPAQAAGMVKGASLERGILFGENGEVVNQEGLRFADEVVRHKVLDALGDLALAGGRVPWGRYDLVKPGHAANNALLREIVNKEVV